MKKSILLSSINLLLFIISFFINVFYSIYLTNEILIYKLIINNISVYIYFDSFVSISYLCFFLMIIDYFLYFTFGISNFDYKNKHVLNTASYHISFITLLIIWFFANINYNDITLNCIILSIILLLLILIYINTMLFLKKPRFSCIIIKISKSIILFTFLNIFFLFINEIIKINFKILISTYFISLSLLSIIFTLLFSDFVFNIFVIYCCYNFILKQSEALLEYKTLILIFNFAIIFLNIFVLLLKIKSLKEYLNQ